MTTPAVQSSYRFATVPEWVLFHPDLTPLAVRVYAVLDRHGRDPESCFPSHERIASLAHCAPRTVYRAVLQLEAVGAIQVVPRWRRGHRISNGYMLAADAQLVTVQTTRTRAPGTPTKPRAGGAPNHAPARGEREPGNDIPTGPLTGSHAARAALRATQQRSNPTTTPGEP